MTTPLTPAQLLALKDVEAARQRRLMAEREYRGTLSEARAMGITLTALGNAAGTSCEAVRMVLARNRDSFSRAS